MVHGSFQKARGPNIDLMPVEGLMDDLDLPADRANLFEAGAAPISRPEP